ncbi:BRO family protein [Caminibacter pacificus]|nr:phage antirepressor [Caminibacter pacificus]ROR39070.1 prophage antirepressor-like protein [Caminibacter pacificus]
MEIKVFNNHQFGAVRVLKDEAGEPWFVAKDVATILGYKRPADAIRQLVDKEDKGVGKIPTPGGMQEMTIINESGFYALVFNSKLPQAKKFKRWVTNEVLPAIRKHGLYATDEVIEKTLNNPDFMIEILQKFKEEKQKRIELQQELQQNLPYIVFAKQVETSKTSIKIREWAKIISKRGYTIGQNRLFKWLRDNGYLMINNEPYQAYIDRGYFEVKTKAIHTPTGEKQVKTTYVTSKGQVALTEKIIEYLKAKKAALQAG